MDQNSNSDNENSNNNYNIIIGSIMGGFLAISCLAVGARAYYYFLNRQNSSNVSDRNSLTNLHHDQSSSSRHSQGPLQDEELRSSLSFGGSNQSDTLQVRIVNLGIAPTPPGQGDGSEERAPTPPPRKSPPKKPNPTQPAPTEPESTRSNLIPESLTPSRSPAPSRSPTPSGSALASAVPSPLSSRSSSSSSVNSLQRAVV